METTKIALFRGKKIRKTIYNNEWWFSVVDVIEALTDSARASAYWTAMKVRVKNEDGIQLSTICRQLKLPAPDGKMRETDCADTESIFRIIQSIPSPKAEPFKRWLAKVGYERVQEIENPELATKRTRLLYKLKGYSDEISKAAFGVTPSQYKKFKGLRRENLRDHMNDLELIFTMLGEKVTTEISQQERPNTFSKNKIVAKRGGNVAGVARKETEKEIGRNVISKENYLKKPESQKYQRSVVGNSLRLKGKKL